MDKDKNTGWQRYQEKKSSFWLLYDHIAESKKRLECTRRICLDLSVVCALLVVVYVFTRFGA